MKKIMIVVYVIAVLVVCVALRMKLYAKEATTEVEIVSGEVTPTPEVIPSIQIAILLDTSNSMDGLIDQAKAQLWKIVNEFVAVRRNGKMPEFQVALYEYGNSSLSAKEGYIRMVLPLTTDLDKVSEELFALTTNGGQEYCGQVIKVAMEELAWSEAPKDYKAIFIAGNEPFTQGDVDYHDACKVAIEKGVVVNTIFCGSYDEGVSTKWKDGALLADGTYMNIDQNREIVHIDAPQDEELVMLGTKLNETYIPYGVEGESALENQAAQDKNAASISGANLAQRAVTKASYVYKNTNWDLVDALKEETIKLEDVEDENLPEEMQGMTLEERQAYVQTKADERAEIQEKINELNEARKKYVAEKMKELELSGEDTLDLAIIKAIKTQLIEKDFELE